MIKGIFRYPSLIYEVLLADEQLKEILHSNPIISPLWKSEANKLPVQDKIEIITKILDKLCEYGFTSIVSQFAIFCVYVSLINPA